MHGGMDLGGSKWVESINGWAEISPEVTWDEMSEKWVGSWPAQLDPIFKAFWMLIKKNALIKNNVLPLLVDGF